jgi:hypothetical protein
MVGENHNDLLVAGRPASSRSCLVRLACVGPRTTEYSVLKRGLHCSERNGRLTLGNRDYSRECAIPVAPVLV